MLNINKFNIIGALAYFPITFNQYPIFITPILCSIYLVLIGNFRFNKIYILTLIGFASIVILTNFLNPGLQQSWFYSIFSTLAILFIALLRFSDLDGSSVLDGFAIAGLLLSIYVLLLTFYSGNYVLYTEGSFFKPGNRLWAREYIFGWPNVYSGLSIVSAYWLRHQNKTLLAWLILATCLMTASRVAIMGILILGLVDPCNNKYLRYLIRTIILIILATIFITVLDGILGNFLYDRVFKYSDRVSIFEALINAFMKRPFGYGNVPFDYIDGGLYYVSFHSSFLKILVRYGFIGFLLFIIIVKVNFKKLIKSKLWHLYLILIIMGLPQDFLLQLNIFFIFIILINHIENHKL